MERNGRQYSGLDMVSLFFNLLIPFTSQKKYTLKLRWVEEKRKREGRIIMSGIVKECERREDKM